MLDNRYHVDNSSNLFSLPTSERKTTKKKAVRKDYTIKPSLQGKYDDQPLFQDKVDRANFILKKFGVPKFDSTK